MILTFGRKVLPFGDLHNDRKVKKPEMIGFSQVSRNGDMSFFVDISGVVSLIHFFCATCIIFFLGFCFYRYSEHFFRKHVFFRKSFAK